MNLGGAWAFDCRQTLVESRTHLLVDLGLGGVAGASASVAIGMGLIPTVLTSVLCAMSSAAARSILRAFLAALAVMGAMATVFVIGFDYALPLLRLLGPSASFEVACVGIATVFASWAFRVRTRRGSRVTEVVAVMASLAVSLYLAVITRTGGSLLRFIVTPEDNEAWIRTSVGILTSDLLGTGFAWGYSPFTGGILALTSSVISPDSAAFNGVFAAYALVLISAPLALGAVLKPVAQHWLATTVGTLAGSAFLVSHLGALALLGHLSAAWAVVVLLAALGGVVSAGGRLRDGVMALLLLGCLAATWFPIAPIAALGLLWVVWKQARSSTRGGLTLALLVLPLGYLVWRVLSYVLGPPGSANLQDSLFRIKVAYRASGGVLVLPQDQVLSAVLLVCGLSLVTPLFVSRESRGSYGLLVRALVVVILYCGVVLTTGSLISGSSAYGQEKLVFVVSVSVTALLVGLIAAVRESRYLVVAVLVGLAVYLGLDARGARPISSLNWPGSGDEPAWLQPLLGVALARGLGEGTTITCVGGGTGVDCLCSRAGRGFTAGGGCGSEHSVDCVERG